MQIIIVGAGIGGLSAALALGRLGHNIVVLEQTDAIREVGAGLQIGPNGSRILARWGLLDKALEQSMQPPLGWLADGVTGADICTFPLDNYARRYHEFPYLHLHRADLQALLWSACESLSNVDVQLNSQLQSLNQIDREVHATTTSGAVYRGDLVIGADGLSSQVRKILFPNAAPSYTGYIAWRGLVSTRQIQSNLDLRIPRVWTGSGMHLVHYPLRGGTELNLVACAQSSEVAAESWTGESSVDEVLATFHQFAEPVRDLVSCFDKIMRWGLYQGHADSGWVQGHAALLGDAAHAMLPSMAQGAVMAMEDAELLAHLLVDNELLLGEVLVRYERIRRSRVGRVQKVAADNMRFFHHQNGLLGKFGYSALHLAGADAQHLIGRRYDWIYRYKTEDVG